VVFHQSPSEKAHHSILLHLQAGALRTWSLTDLAGALIAMQVMQEISMAQRGRLAYLDLYSSFAIMPRATVALAHAQLSRATHVAKIVTICCNWLHCKYLMPKWSGTKHLILSLICPMAIVCKMSHLKNRTCTAGEICV
jgi:hypothetical protein